MKQWDNFKRKGDTVIGYIEDGKKCRNGFFGLIKKGFDKLFSILRIIIVLLMVVLTISFGTFILSAIGLLK